VRSSQTKLRAAGLLFNVGKPPLFLQRKEFLMAASHRTDNVTLSRTAAKPHSKTNVHRPSPWEGNDELLQDLREAWMNGTFSVSGIGVFLFRKHKDFFMNMGVTEVTTGMVTGKAGRMGLGKKPSRIKDGRSSTRNKEFRRKRIVPAPPAATPPPMVRTLVPGAAPVMAEKNPEPEMVRVPLTKLSADTCRWPLGDPQDENFRFCGCRTGGSTYCEYHARIAYQPVQRRLKPGLATVPA
jgi:GcrA cell cycle regulator